MKLLFIFTPIILAFIINIVIFTSGWNSNRDSSFSKLPPGWVVGMVWSIILGLLGYVAYLVREDAITIILVSALIFLCLTYPFYTQGLANVAVMGAANLGILLFSIFVTIMVFRYTHPAIGYMIPLLLWLSYVNIVGALG